jgi:beta-phosphoglucomutase-like phosphatase (HAD superfamily)
MTTPTHTTFAADALLIDCDGVLVDSHDAAAHAWKSWARRWSPDFDFHRDIEHGRRIADTVAELVEPDAVKKPPTSSARNSPTPPRCPDGMISPRGVVASSVVW